MFRKMCMVLIVIQILFFPSAKTFASQKTDTLYDRYYQVMYSHIVERSPMGTEWSVWIAKTILYYSAQYQVDPLLVTALFQQESGFNMAALSRTGAIGIAQLQPETAAGLGFDPTDPAQNIEGGIRYLAGQLSQFSSTGAWAATNAVAAYNAGPGAIIKYGGVPPYAETQNHVYQIAAIYQQLQEKMGY